jgi:hypothetical protein
MRGADVGASQRRAAIFAALADEPTVFVPGAATTALRAAQSKAEVRRGRGLVDSPRFRAGFAAAASVVTVGVVGWIGFQDRLTPQITTAQATQNVAQSANVNVQAVALTVSPATRELPANVRDYIAVHRQIPNADLIVPVAHVRSVSAR